MKPFSQQMGVTEGYSDEARMAMSHPAFLDQAERPQVHFGSAAQFGVKWHQEEFKKKPIIIQAEKSNKLSLSSSEVMRRKDIFYSGSLLNIPEYKYVGLAVWP